MRARSGAALIWMALMPVLAGCATRSGTPPPPERAFVTPRLPHPAGVARVDGVAMQGALLHGRIASDERLTLDGRPVPVAPDGQFVIGLDRDAAAVATLVTTSTDGLTATLRLPVSARAWNISRLPTLAKVPVPQPAFEARRPAELARIAAARALVTDAAGWRQRFRWPATGRISTLFGSQRIYANGEAGAYHSGIDIARPTGTIVLAPADGVVILAADAPFTLEGNLLMLDHGAGLSSAFLHLSRIDVAVGEHVRQGQPIALVGSTGRATGPHLHWGLQWQGARLDPLLVAGAMPLADAATAP